MIHALLALWSLGFACWSLYWAIVATKTGYRLLQTLAVILQLACFTLQFQMWHDSRKAPFRAAAQVDETR